VIAERSLLRGRVNNGVLGGVARDRVDSIVRYSSRRGERGYNERGDQRDTQTGQRTLLLR
jgi:hypothetical protein